MKKTLLMAAVLGTISSPVWAATGTVLGGADSVTDVSKLKTVQTMEYTLWGANATSSITTTSGSAVEGTTMAGGGAKTMAMVLTDGRIAAGTGGAYDGGATYTDADGNTRTAYISPVVSKIEYNSDIKKGTINILGQNISGVDVAKMNNKLAFANLPGYVEAGISTSLSYNQLNDDIVQTALNAHATGINALADAAANLDTRITNLTINSGGGNWSYTDREGNKVVKGTDGNYYKESDLNASGNPNQGATAVDTKDIVNSAVNVDGTTTNPTVISNVADAVKANDAVNKGQLDKAVAAAKTTVTAGDNVTVTPTTKADGSMNYEVAVKKNLTGLETVEVVKDGITTKVDENGVSVTDGTKTGIYNQDGMIVNNGSNTTVVAPEGMIVTDGNNTAIYDANGVKAGDVSITNNGVDAGNKTIINVADAVNDTDAVNKGQMDKAITDATAKAKTTVSAGDNVTVTSSTNKDGSTDYKVAVNKNLAGLETVEVVKDGVTSTIDGNGVGVTDGTKSAVYNQDGMAATDGTNTTVVASGGMIVTDGTNTAVYDANGVKAGDVSITNNGIDAGNKTITNVADAVKDTDAVNKGQMEKSIADAATKAKTTVSAGDNVTVTSSTNKNGSTNYEVAVNKNLKGLETVEVVKDGVTSTTDGNGVGVTDGTNTTVVAPEGMIVTDGNNTAIYDANGVKAGDVSITHNGINAGNKTITNVADAVKDNDAVNKGQMEKSIADAATKAKTTVSAGDNVTVTSSTNKNGSTNYEVAVNKDLTGLNSVEVENNGVTTRTNGDGIHVTDGTTGAIYNQNGVNVSDGTNNTVVAPEGMIVTDGNNTAIYDANGVKAGDVSITNNGIDAGNKTITNVADAVNDTDAVNKGQMDKAIAGSKVTLTEGNNIAITPTTNTDGSTNYEVALAKDLTGLNSVTVENGGVKTVTDGSGVTVSNGTKSTTYGPDGIKAGNVTITSDGINAGNTVISNVADGVNPTDAVNKGQLDAISNGTKQLSNRLDKVGAGAAALAALHPLDFNPDDKWNFAVGYGNYAGENAMAVGAFYRPNEDTMFSVAGNMGNGENMINAGVSFKLGQSSGVTNSRVAMAQEIKNLKNSVDMLMKQNQVLANTIGEMSGKQMVSDGDFSDVPMDHWAYGYVKSLAQQGIIEGYPDGMFKGDLAMTRYEFAALLYRALQAGATIDGDMKRAIDEFKPQLERVRLADTFRIDRVSGKDNDRHKVDRVRVNGQKGRDVYGNHITVK